MARRMSVVAVVGMATLALFASGCGSDTSGGSSGDGGSGGGAIIVRGCTPENALIPANTNEVCGGNVLDAVNAKLMHYNPDTAEPEMDIAESIETEDNQTFTVKIKPDYMFQDNTMVKAKNFVDAWNWAAYAPNGNLNGYFMEPIQGYADVQCETDDAGACTADPTSKEMSGLAVVDDTTFTIKTAEKVSNLPVRLGYTVFAPLPDVFFTDPKSPEFSKLPIGAGPFKITSNDEREMVLEEFADYSGDYKPKVDKVTFRIYNDANAAYNDTVANNLDFTDLIPPDVLVGDQWKNDLDGRNEVRETGIIQTMTPAVKDKQLTNVDLLIAFSKAIDRETITQQIFSGTRVPATGWVSPVVDGYKADACGDSCVYDAKKAKDMYDQAGGYKGTLPLTVNGDGGHKQWADAVCNGWKKDLGVSCQVVITPDFKTLRKQVNNQELTGFHRSGWQMDYPSIENFLAPLYATGASSNDGKYSNPEFDKLLAEAAAADTAKKSNELYQQAEDVLATDMAVIPQWYAATPVGWSENVDNVKVTPFSTLDLTSITKK